MVQKYAGFWKRFLAWLLDVIIIGVGSGIIYLGNSNDAFTGGAGIVIGWLYFSLMESSSLQATVGKLALNLKVTDLKGRRISFARATGRHFAKFLSAIILLIGFIMIAFTEKKQGLHDKLADTLVVRK